MAAQRFENTADGMRAGMRRVPQGVTVISLVDGEGQWAAMTASSMTSVSAEPPSLLVCVNRDASLHAGLSESRPFCVNVLPHDLQDISNLCAGQAAGRDRFAVGDWQTDAATGLPHLVDALVSFFCTPDAILQYGTHLVCVGKLDAVRVSDKDGAPLIYHDGAYARLADPSQTPKR